jgi:hypothetical protein
MSGWVIVNNSSSPSCSVVAWMLGVKTYEYSKAEPGIETPSPVSRFLFNNRSSGVVETYSQKTRGRGRIDPAVGIKTGAQFGGLFIEDISINGPTEQSPQRVAVQASDLHSKEGSRNQGLDSTHPAAGKKSAEEDEETTTARTFWLCVNSGSFCLACWAAAWKTSFMFWGRTIPMVIVVQ